MRQNFDVSINDYNRELFTSFKTVLEMREGESPVHVLMKVLGATIYYEPGMLIEPADVDPQYRPDVLLRHGDGRPRLWIECGQVRTVKLDKLTSRYTDTQFVVVKKSAREAAMLLERCEKEVRRPTPIEYLGFDSGFAENCAAQVMGRNDCTAIISDQTLQFIINGNQYDSKLHLYRHAPPKYSGKSYV